MVAFHTGLWLFFLLLKDRAPLEEIIRFRQFCWFFLASFVVKEENLGLNFTFQNKSLPNYNLTFLIKFYILFPSVSIFQQAYLVMNTDKLLRNLQRHKYLYKDKGLRRFYGKIRTSEIITFSTLNPTLFVGMKRPKMQRAEFMKVGTMIVRVC